MLLIRSKGCYISGKHRNMNHNINNIFVRRLMINPLIPVSRKTSNCKAFMESTDTSLLSSLNTFASDFHVIAKGIILYTLFYTSMNWWYFRRIQKDVDNHEKENKNKK